MEQKVKTDKVFSEGIRQVGDFKFDEKVAEVFPDMIKRSVPGYEYVLKMCGLFAERFARDNSNCYDLGCSLGAVSWAMRPMIRANNCQIIAVDNSEAMLKKAQEQLALTDDYKTPIKFVNADIRSQKYERNALTVLNYTLQFLPPEDRYEVLKRIFESMYSGSALILSEKVTFEELANKELFIDIYHSWKMTNHYSELEIRQKRNALEKVLIPDTIDTHKARLKAIGFERVEIWFQSFNFISMVAFKP